MELIADGLLIATAMTAGLYCMVLSRRLRRLGESGNGIGPQIEALDRALEDTRAALAETREGVSELRGSTKAVIAKLARETVRGEDVAKQIERSVEAAKTTMQRLYEVGERIEATGKQPAEAALAGDTDAPPDAPPDDPGVLENVPVIEAQPIDRDNDSVAWADDSAGAADEPGEDGESTGSGPRVALPEGKVVDPEAAEAGEAVKVGEVVEAVPVEAAGERSGSVLKAERVVL